MGRRASQDWEFLHATPWPLNAVRRSHTLNGRRPQPTPPPGCRLSRKLVGPYDLPSNIEALRVIERLRSYTRVASKVAALRLVVGMKSREGTPKTHTSALLWGTRSGAQTARTSSLFLRYPVPPLPENHPCRSRVVPSSFEEGSLCCRRRRRSGSPPDSGGAGAGATGVVTG